MEPLLTAFLVHSLMEMASREMLHGNRSESEGGSAATVKADRNTTVEPRRTLLISRRGQLDNMHW